MPRLRGRVWGNPMLTIATKMRIYWACVLTTLLYGSESWTPYAHQERRLNVFHMRNLRRILGVRWQDHIRNKDILRRAGVQSIYALLAQRRLRWLGHVKQMAEGRIPKDLLFGELAHGSRSTGRPLLRYRDVCKRDLTAGHISASGWETMALDRESWRRAIWTAASRIDDMRLNPRIKRTSTQTPGMHSRAQTASEFARSVLLLLVVTCIAM